MKKVLRFSLVGLVLAVLIVGTSGLTLGTQPFRAMADAGYAPDRILVRFQPGVSASTMAAIHRANGAVVIREIPQIGVQVLRVPANQVPALVAAYSRNPNVLYAEPDYIAYVVGDPDDKHFSWQWGLDNDGQVYKYDKHGNPISGTEDADIDFPEAWDFLTDRAMAEIKIAILDTGIDQDHEDLCPPVYPASCKIVDNENFTDSPTVDDKYGHGTHVAGIAAAITNNKTGVAGVGYNSSLMNVKVLNDHGWGYVSGVIGGILWAADEGAHVINMSLGSSWDSESLEGAVDKAWGMGVVVVAAAGNSNDNSPLYPAYYENCIAVAATDDDDAKASFSSYGDWVDVAAPGVDIFSTFPNHKYRIKKWRSLDYDYGSGTSMASPHVAGLAGLLFGQDPSRTNTHVRTLIERTADEVGDIWSTYSIPRINACNAVAGTAAMGALISLPASASSALSTGL